MYNGSAALLFFILSFNVSIVSPAVIYECYAKSTHLKIDLKKVKLTFSL